jgi:uncharacterized membrane protein YadS
VSEKSNDVVVEEKPQSEWTRMIKSEDYWAIWLGALLLIFALIMAFSNLPSPAKFAESQAIMQQESERAPFKTIAYIEAEATKKGMRARNEEPFKTLYAFTNRPKGWDANPISALYMSEGEAAAIREANKERYAQAQEATVAARAKAEEAEGAAAVAGFKDGVLNEQAEEAISAWQAALSAESKAKGAATTSAYNLIPGLLVLMVFVGLFFSIGLRFMGHNLRQFLVAFPVIFALAILAYILANHATMKALGLSYVLFALFMGLFIANTIGTPKWLKPAVQTEYYIKTGLVLLGAGIMIGKIALIGIPGVFVTWVVTPIVLVVTFWFGQRVIKVPSKELNIVVSSDMSVSGVSAAIATAAACRAKKEELTLAIGMSMIFVAIMIFLIPAIANAVGMHHVWAGAWIGGTVDNTGSVVAAGELIGPVAMYVAATIKMIQNVMIGVIAFGVAAYWALKVERERSGVSGQVNLGFVSALGEIWSRFPRFILGFLGASVVFSLLYSFMGHDWAKVVIDDGVLAWANRFRGWFFALAFVSIGLATNFRELAVHLKGGKPVILYVFGQSFNLVLTLLVAYLMFFVIFPGITEQIVP